MIGLIIVVLVFIILVVPELIMLPLLFIFGILYIVLEFILKLFGKSLDD